MLTRSRLDLRDERGTTMPEVLVATWIGLVVLAALSMVIVVTLHGSARVSARVEATQHARIVVTRITEQLHSACVAPKVAPVRAGSSGEAIRFFRADFGQASRVEPAPTLTEVRLEGDTLSQSEYAVTGEAPTWTETATKTAGPRTLLTGISPVSPGAAVFSYYGFLEGTLTELVPSPTLTTSQALSVVEVRIAVAATPRSGSPVPDAGAPAAIRNAAVLSLTPPSFNEKANALPCR